MKVDIVSLVTRLTVLEEQGMTRERRVQELEQRVKAQEKELAKLAEQLAAVKDMLLPVKADTLLDQKIVSEWLNGAEER